MSAHACSKLVYGAGVRGYGCRNSATVLSNDRWYCRIHDPAVIKRKNDDLGDRMRADYERTTALKTRAAELSAALGCGDLYFNAHARPLGRYEPALVITFDEIAVLLTRLKKPEEDT